MEGHSDIVKNFAFAEKDLIVSCSYDQTIKFW